MIFQIFTLLLYIDIVTIYTHRITSEEVEVFTYIVMLFLSTLYFKTKIIDILPICSTLRRMWKETASGNQMRLIVSGKTSELITIMKGVAQGNIISLLTFAMVK